MNTCYLTYGEYVSYGGTLLSQEFERLAFKAQKRIDYLTDSRVKYMSEVPDAVKLCMLSLLEIEKAVGAESQATSPVVTSYSTDGYSESYGKALGASEASTLMNKTVGDYLYGEVDDDGVPLLYRGVRG